MKTVLVADHDSAVRRLESAALRNEGYEVVTAHSLDHALTLLGRRPLAAVVIDPGRRCRVEIIERVRAHTEAPLIAVSEQGAEWDKVEVLDAGADDYLTKPFGAEELLARLRAVQRRCGQEDEAQAITTADFTILPEACRVLRADGSDVALSAMEWRLLHLLVSHPDRIVGHEDVLRALWGSNGGDKAGSLRVHLSNLRHKVEPDPSHPRYLLTAPGLGLRFSPCPEPVDHRPVAVP